MKYEYTPKNVCARSFEIEVDNGVIKDISIKGGCRGNKQAVELLCKGRSINEIIGILKGIQCGDKGTSCPDQLAKALAQALNE